MMGDDAPAPDAADNPTPKVCPLPETTADMGTLSALKAQRCNVSGSMGTRKWYRLSATMPGGTTDVVQVELWDGQGAFAGGAVHTGTFQLTGAELDYATCGVCVRAVGDKGTTGAKTYFATGGTVEVTSVGAGGATLSAKITNITLAEVDATNKKVTGGCTANVAGATVTGTVQDLSGTGTGGGGGGGGGTGGGSCPTTVGD